MPSSVALFAWAVCLAALLYFDPAKTGRTSSALWVPVIWMFILGSRLPSQWLGGQVGMTAAAFEQGNPLDAILSSTLILLAIVILVNRSLNWSVILARNAALVALLAFALVSFVWSDFPLVALKRWFRDLGTYLIVLVVLSDRNPLEAVRLLLRRFCYLLIPLSVLIVRYYPELGKQYDVWTGVATYVGATTSKNMLGLACLLSGLFLFWDTLTRWSNRRNRQTKRILALNATFMGMTLWLLNLSNSATSRVCLLLGCLVIAAAHSKPFKRYPGLLKALIPTTFVLYLVVVSCFGLGGVAGAVGRDPTLTDRTKIWAVLLAMHTNPLLGTGYESFWLGPRLLWVWQSPAGHVNEAHNGYLQVYLNLGLVGLVLLLAFLIASYRTICKRGKTLSGLGSLGVALWIILAFYNTSEAAFGGGVLWLAFLSAALVVPEPRVHRKSLAGKPGATARPLDFAAATAPGTGDNEPVPFPTPLCL